MGKEKNLGKLKSRFEVRGGLINEYDFNQNQGAIAEEERNRFARREDESALREGQAEAAPQTEAERVEQLMMEAHEKAEKNLRKKGKQSGAQSPQTKARAGVAKQAGKKGTGGAKKKSAGKKSGAGKQAKPAKKAAGKSGAGKSGGKKSAAKKSGGRGR
ncbi:MAG TPA: hypothetical protein VM095_06990 [Pyrinomonadaceae bacterium]|nr:hypothetical protein [Pyrinomonadaceae bacterium]